MKKYKVVGIPKMDLGGPWHTHPHGKLRKNRNKNRTKLVGSLIPTTPLDPNAVIDGQGTDSFIQGPSIDELTRREEKGKLPRRKQLQDMSYDEMVAYVNETNAMLKEQGLNAKMQMPDLSKVYSKKELRDLSKEEREAYKNMPFYDQIKFRTEKIRKDDFYNLDDITNQEIVDPIPTTTDVKPKRYGDDHYNTQRSILASFDIIEKEYVLPKYEQREDGSYFKVRDEISRYDLEVEELRKKYETIEAQMRASFGDREGDPTHAEDWQNRDGKLYRKQLNALGAELQNLLLKRREQAGENVGVQKWSIDPETGLPKLSNHPFRRIAEYDYQFNKETEKEMGYIPKNYLLAFSDVVVYPKESDLQIKQQQLNKQAVLLWTLGAIEGYIPDKQVPIGGTIKDLENFISSYETDIADFKKQKTASNAQLKDYAEYIGVKNFDPKEGNLASEANYKLLRKAMAKNPSDQHLMKIYKDIFMKDFDPNAVQLTQEQMGTMIDAGWGDGSMDAIYDLAKVVAYGAPAAPFTVSGLVTLMNNPLFTLAMDGYFAYETPQMVEDFYKNTKKIMETTDPRTWERLASIPGIALDALFVQMGISGGAKIVKGLDKTRKTLTGAAKSEAELSKVLREELSAKNKLSSRQYKERMRDPNFRKEEELIENASLEELQARAATKGTVMNVKGETIIQSDSPLYLQYTKKGKPGVELTDASGKVISNTGTGDVIIGMGKTERISIPGYNNATVPELYTMPKVKQPWIREKIKLPGGATIEIGVYNFDGAFEAMGKAAVDMTKTAKPTKSGVSLLTNSERSAAKNGNVMNVIQNGKTVGEVMTYENSKGQIVIQDIDVISGSQKTGIASEVYQLVNEMSGGKPVVSSNMFVEGEGGVKPGEKLWESLVKKGKAVKTETGYQMKPIETEAAFEVNSAGNVGLTQYNPEATVIEFPGQVNITPANIEKLSKHYDIIGANGEYLVLNESALETGSSAQRIPGSAAPASVPQELDKALETLTPQEIRASSGMTKDMWQIFKNNNPQKAAEQWKTKVSARQQNKSIIELNNAPDYYETALSAGVSEETQKMVNDAVNLGKQQALEWVSSNEFLNRVMKSRNISMEEARTIQNRFVERINNTPINVKAHNPNATINGAYSNTVSNTPVINVYGPTTEYAPAEAQLKNLEGTTMHEVLHAANDSREVEGIEFLPPIQIPENVSLDTAGSIQYLNRFPEQQVRAVKAINLANNAGIIKRDEEFTLQTLSDLRKYIQTEGGGMLPGYTDLNLLLNPSVTGNQVKDKDIVNLLNTAFQYVLPIAGTATALLSDDDEMINEYGMAGLPLIALTSKNKKARDLLKKGLKVVRNFFMEPVGTAVKTSNAENRLTELMVNITKKDILEIEKIVETLPNSFFQGKLVADDINAIDKRATDLKKLVKELKAGYEGVSSTMGSVTGKVLYSDLSGQAQNVIDNIAKTLELESEAGNITRGLGDVGKLRTNNKINNNSDLAFVHAAIYANKVKQMAYTEINSTKARKLLDSRINEAVKNFKLNLEDEAAAQEEFTQTLDERISMIKEVLETGLYKGKSQIPVDKYKLFFSGENRPGFYNSIAHEGSSELIDIRRYKDSTWLNKELEHFEKQKELIKKYNSLDDVSVLSAAEIPELTTTDLMNKRFTTPAEEFSFLQDKIKIVVDKAADKRGKQKMLSSKRNLLASEDLTVTGSGNPKDPVKDITITQSGETGRFYGDNRPLNAEEKVITNLKTGKTETVSVTPGDQSKMSIVNNELKAESAGDMVPEITENLIPTVKDNIEFIEDLTGGKVFGSSLLTVNGVPTVPGDYELFLTESQFKKIVENKNFEFGSTPDANRLLNKAKYNGEELDMLVLQNGPDGLVKQDNSHALELFRQFHPEKYQKAVKDKALKYFDQMRLEGDAVVNTRVETKIPMSAEELIASIDPEVKSIMDAFEAGAGIGKQKHMLKSESVLLYANPKKVQKAQELYVKSIAGPNAKVAPDFTNWFKTASEEELSQFLVEAGYIDNLYLMQADNLFNNPDRMQAILNDWYINNTITTRDITLTGMYETAAKKQFKENPDLDFDIVTKALTEWDLIAGGGNVSGGGLNMGKGTGSSNFKGSKVGDIRGYTQFKFGNSNTPLDLVRDVFSKTKGETEIPEIIKVKIEKLGSEIGIRKKMETLQDVLKETGYRSARGEQPVVEFFTKVGEILETPFIESHVDSDIFNNVRYAGGTNQWEALGESISYNFIRDIDVFKSLMDRERVLNETGKKDINIRTKDEFYRIANLYKLNAGEYQKNIENLENTMTKAYGEYLKATDKLVKANAAEDVQSFMEAGKELEKIKERIITTQARFEKAHKNATDLDDGYKVYKYHLKGWVQLLLASMATAGIVTAPFWLDDMLRYIEGDDPQEVVKKKTISRTRKSNEPKNNKIEQMDGSIEVELTPEEVEKYKAGGYIVEEIR